MSSMGLFIDVVLIVVIIATIFGNLFAIFAICVERQLRTPSNVFITSLAVSDLMVGILAMPFSLSSNVISREVFRPVFCRLYVTSAMTFCTTSSWHLCIISIDRYLHIVKPFHYKRYVTRRLASAIVVALWIISFIVHMFIPIYVGIVAGGYVPSQDGAFTANPLLNNLTENHEHDVIWSIEGYRYCRYYPNLTYEIIMNLCEYILPCIVIMSIYARIFFIVRMRAKKMRGCRLRSLSNGSTDEAGGINKILASPTVKRKVVRQVAAESKTAAMIGVLIGVFLASCSPYYIFNFTRIYFQVTASAKEEEVFAWLVYFNSCLNPYVYTVSHPQFRKVLKKLLTKKKKRREIYRFHETRRSRIVS